jgi:hypothetical protein
MSLGERDKILLRGRNERGRRPVAWLVEPAAASAVSLCMARIEEYTALPAGRVRVVGHPPVKVH